MSFLLYNKVFTLSNQKISSVLLFYYQKPGSAWTIFPPGQYAFGTHYLHSASSKDKEYSPDLHRSQTYPLWISPGTQFLTNISNSNLNLS